MAFLESVQELYKSMESDLTPYLEFCKFSVFIDSKTLENNINLYAEKEEPSEIICIGLAKSNGNSGFFSSFSGSSVETFLFTQRKLYLERNVLKFSEIDSIAHNMETTTGLFGKTKTKSYLIVTKKSGEIVKFTGNLAIENIAGFLDGIVKIYAENPPEQLPSKEFPRKKLIDKLIGAMNLSSIFDKSSKLNNEKLNSIIIKFGMNELKSSFAAGYKKELFFSNDNLYYSENGEFKKIPYNLLGAASYSETDSKNSDGEITTTKTVSLRAKDGKVIFKNKSDIAEKKVADFFNKIISDSTGTEVKTETQINKIEGKGSVASIVNEAFSSDFGGYGNLKRHEVIDMSNGAIKNLYSKEKEIKAAFFNDHFEIQYPNTEYKSFKWKDISIALSEASGKKKEQSDNFYLGNLALILLDNENKECFYGVEETAYKKEYNVYDWDNGLTANLMYLIDDVITYLKKKTIDTKPAVSIEGDAIKDEKTRKLWNDLMGKWNEIFSRQTPIECKAYTDSELAKLPKWRRVKHKDKKDNSSLIKNGFYFTIGDAVLEVYGDMELEEIPYYNTFDYYPEPYSESEKYFHFSSYYNGFSHICVLELVSENKTIKLESSGCKYLENFFNSLHSEYKWKGIYENIISFSQRIKASYIDLKETYIRLKENETAKLNDQLLDDLSNW